jgi:signal transduction histidine kinase/ActR/RegA family two-component response regulator
VNGATGLPHRASAPEFLAGGGEMGALMRAHDWSTSPLGPPDTWPPSLRAVVALMINSRYPMFVAWGPELAFLYNDGYRPIFGAKHPHTLGLPFREVWSEIWDDIWPLIERALAGEATFNEDLHLVMERNGYPEDTWYSFSYSPVRDESGQIAGMFCACTETTQKVLAERRVAAERDRLAQLFEQAPGFICTLRGPEHVFEFVNAAHRRLFKSQGWVGRPVREALSDIEGQGFHELLDQVYATGERAVVHSAPVRFRISPDAPEEERLLDFIYAPMLDDAGAVSGIFCEGYDVTERKRAEAALRDSEARYRMLFGSIDEGFCILEFVNGEHGPLSDYRYVEANPALEAQSGVVGVVGKTVREVLPGEAQEWIDIFGKVLRTGEPIRFERVLTASNRSLELFAFRVEPEARRQVAVIFQDVTARRRAEDALRRLNDELEQRVADALAERKLLADIVERTDAFVQVADLGFRWLAINKASADEFERIFSVRPKVGDSMLDILADRPEHQAAVRAVWSRALAGEEFTEIGEFGDPALDRRCYEMKYNTLRDRDGNRIGAYQFVHDVTQRLRDQERLAQAEEALRQAQKMESIGQLTGGVAHDFNNLLQAIASGLQLLDRRDDPKLHRRVFDSMHQAVERGARLTRQLLAFSRRQPLRPEPIDLAWQVGGIRELLARSLRGDIQLEMSLGPDTWPVEVDPGELERVMLNLCINARDAMPEGGTIAVTAGNTPDLMQGDTCGDFVRLSVRDTGIGIPPDVRARVFEPFFTTKEVGKGSGLGLAQVYGFAKQSGGSVEIDSEVGRGTTVTLLLPRSRKQPAPIEHHPGATDRPQPGGEGALQGQVLLVEDDEEVAALTTEMLRAIDCRVTHVASAAAALDALAGGQPIDVVFSDIMMPGGMSGLELAREVKRRRPELPVVLTTGYETAAAGAKAEGIGLLLKPYRVEALAETLRAHLTNEDGRARRGAAGQFGIEARGTRSCP